ncbi:adenylosuccinate synthetase [Tamlana sp. I1]|uniref:adenylosuccinate synthetase n=1 Tax=Tamlana sp. I1 TaxID=2762061 RepID=UPI00188FC086|nr:adenylosuccinate synthetase [Tamlana sp. I1]
MHPFYNLLVLQLPMGTPNPDDNKPLDLSDPFEVIVFIVLPVIIVILYFLWRKQKQKNKK